MLTTSTGRADVYRWQDAQGRSHFSDRPAQGAEKLSIPTPNILSGSEYRRIERVFDGDTVSLDGGERVRLLGINTPEIAHGYKPEESGGESARRWLSAQLAGRKVRLEGDVTERDRYHRRLAHLFTTEGLHINLELVKQGLATTDIYPPNLKYVDALTAAEKAAEQAGRGLWSLPAYRPKPLAVALEQTSLGWQRVTGIAQAAENGKGMHRLLFGGDFEVRIPPESLRLFPPLDNFLHRPLEIRGWLSQRRHGKTMWVRHPSALILR